MRSSRFPLMMAITCLGTAALIAPISLGQPAAGGGAADVSGGSGALGDAGAAHAKPTTITVNGTARVYRAPDYVDINIAVTSQEKTAGAANAAASEKMSKVIEAVKKMGLEKAELQTGDVRLDPRYVSRNNGSSEPQDDVLVGYRADISLRIRTADVNSVPKVLDTAVSAGATRIEGVEFGIKEALAAREEAIRLASQAATRKAKVLAESLDLRLHGIVTAGTTTQQYGGWGRNYGNRMMAQMSGGSGQGESDGGESPVVPGQIEVWAQVDLTMVAKPKG